MASRRSIPPTFALCADLILPISAQRTISAILVTVQKPPPAAKDQEVRFTLELYFASLINQYCNVISILFHLPKVVDCVELTHQSCGAPGFATFSY